MRATIGRLSAMLTAILLLNGCATLRPGGSHRTDAAAARPAAVARKALAARQWVRAVPAAEQAVLLDGDDADLRALLATAYLRAGRFHSAARAFEDAMVLRAPDARTALNLALAHIAAGEPDRALDTLERHAALIPAADRGLALALAGEPRQGAAVLMAAMRVPGADARTRQNLALALALSGEWGDAHMLVALDLDPSAARRRILEWMQFAQPRRSADQVAALLKITPAAEDPGQPVALALSRAVEAPQAVAARIDTVVSAPAAKAVVADATRVVVSVPVPPPAVATPALAPAPGRWFVQVGAYTGVRLARLDWMRIRERVPVLRGHSPSAIAPRSGSRLYRLSVGGFARADARAICTQLLARDGRCYVRTAQGDRQVAWNSAAPVRLAMR